MPLPELWIGRARGGAECDRARKMSAGGYVMKLQITGHFGLRRGGYRPQILSPFFSPFFSRLFSQRFCPLFCQLFLRIDAGFGAALAGLFVITTGAAAQTVVVGTGNPKLDAPAVQAAVDRGGQVVLKGSFSFDIPPINDRTVLVTKAVVISGLKEKSGAMATIAGGRSPFQINAPGLPVTIQGLRFVSPEGSAIDILAVAGLRVANCKIELVRTVLRSGGLTGSVGIRMNLLDRATALDVSGKLSILDNEIDIGGSAAVRTAGIVINQVGRADKPGAIHISGNTVRNVTAHGIDIRDIVGRATIERNEVTTGAAGGQKGPTDVFVDGVRILGSGKYLVTRNSINCAFENAAGIRLQSNSSTAALTEAIVEKNKITMALPEGFAPGDQSAGIELRRFCVGNRILNNEISGRARAALALVSESTPVNPGVFLTPSDNTLVNNKHHRFIHSLADVLIGERVTNTVIVEEKRTILVWAKPGPSNEATEAVRRSKVSGGTNAKAK